MKLSEVEIIAAIISLVLPFFALAQGPNLSKPTMSEVAQTASEIRILNSNIGQAKLLHYAHAITIASHRFNIDPQLLIAITQQESNFRENLPIGRAGEIGICQILHSWVKNPSFIDAFGRVSIRDLKKPSKAFAYAAWILQDVRKSIRDELLPFWSFYNSTNYRNRMNYVIAVNRNLAMIKHSKPLFNFRITELPASVHKTYANQQPLPPKISRKAFRRWSDYLNLDAHPTPTVPHRNHGALCLLQVAAELGISHNSILNSLPKID